MINFTDHFNGMGLEVITQMSDKEFDGYKAEIQEQLKETFADPNFELEVLEGLLAKGNNNYLLFEETDKSIAEIAEGLAPYSENKKKFIMEVYLSIVKIIQKIATDGSMIRHMPIHITKLREDAVLPTYAHNTDAAADVYAVETVTIAPHSKEKIPTGLAFAVPHGYQLNAYLRSGTSLKTPLMLANGVGICDSGYRDEMFILVTNTSDTSYTVEKGERIAQFQLAPMIHMDWIEHEDVKQIGEDRGGGLGSSGK